MRCPFCLAQDTNVIDSRIIEDGKKIRRRRQCKKCNERFTTYEIPETQIITVIKRGGKKERFDIEKLRYSLVRAMEKPDEKKISKILSNIEEAIKKNRIKEISSIEIGKMVLAELEQNDPVSYLRFASVYLKFADIKDFKEAVDKLISSVTSNKES